MSIRNTHSERLRALGKTGHFPGQRARAKSVIRERALSEDVTLDDVAGAVGLSKFHFVRSFKESVGLSPMRYLKSLRVDLAKRALAREDAPISMVAAGAGYRDLSTFNKYFKTLTGETPSRYRDRC